MEDKSDGIFFNGQHNYRTISINAPIFLFIIYITFFFYFIIVDTLRSVSYLFQICNLRCQLYFWHWMGYFSKHWISKFLFFFHWEKCSKMNQFYQLSMDFIKDYNFGHKTWLIILTQVLRHFGSILLWINVHKLIVTFVAVCGGSSGRHSIVFITIHSINLSS